MIRHTPVQVIALLSILVASGCAGAPGSSAVPVTTDLSARGNAALQRTLFITGLGPAVVLFTADLQAKNPQPLAHITQGITRAQGVCIDRNGTLYVSNNTTPPTVVEFRRGSYTPFKTLTKGLFTPGALAVDSSETLYVADHYGQGVLVYPAGAGAPARTIELPYQDHAQIGGMAFDPKGNLLVATFNVERETGEVYSIAPGSNTAVNLDLQGLPGAALGIDRAGNVYVGGDEGDISVFAPGSKKPSRFVTAGGQSGFYSDFAVTPDGSIYWPNYDVTFVYEFAPGASSPTNVFEGGGIDAAVGLW